MPQDHPTDSGTVPAKATRTAVVVVHGMGEQLPMDTMYRCVRTVLEKFDGRGGRRYRHYYSRPERLTDSYEARRCLAPRIPRNGPALQTQTEVYEYHWSYLMTDNKLADLVPTTGRLLVRPPWKVPYGLRGAWVLAWLVLAGLAIGAYLIARKGVEDWTVAGVVAALLGEGVAAFLVVRIVNWLGGAVTRSFVDVVRYLDRSPRSYARRREIRGGMVDLLQALHDKERYSRVIVIAHSLGGYIAYDALVSLWSEMANKHAGPLSDSQSVPLDGLAELEAEAKVLADGGGLTPDGEPAAYRAAQFRLWQSLREQGNPWLVTDFVTLGTPMYFADLLFTRNRTEFETAVRTGVTPSCPPRASSQKVEDRDAGVGRYGWNNRGRTVLHHAAPFAVTRWTNLFFPVRAGFFGDWFGGRVAPLFGPGVWDREVLGNKYGRLVPALAHGKYFDYPDDEDPAGIARVLREVLDLGLEDELAVSRDAPRSLPETDEIR